MNTAYAAQGLTLGVDPLPNPVYLGETINNHFDATITVTDGQYNADLKYYLDIYLKNLGTGREIKIKSNLEYPRIKQFYWLRGGGYTFPTDLPQGRYTLKGVLKTTKGSGTVVATAESPYSTNLWKYPFTITQIDPETTSVAYGETVNFQVVVRRNTDSLQPANPDISPVYLNLNLYGKSSGADSYEFPLSQQISGQGTYTMSYTPISRPSAGTYSVAAYLSGPVRGDYFETIEGVRYGGEYSAEKFSTKTLTIGVAQTNTVNVKYVPSQVAAGSQVRASTTLRTGSVCDSGCNVRLRIVNADTGAVVSAKNRRYNSNAGTRTYRPLLNIPADAPAGNYVYKAIVKTKGRFVTKDLESFKVV